MPVEQMTPPEAWAALDEDPKALYLDVRTEMEFMKGHPEGAINIPVANPGPGGMQLNRDFLKVVEKVIPKDQPVFCGCAAGIRSQTAADLMAQAGYTNLVNIQGGFSGLVQNGQLVVMGWYDEELPVESEVNDENSYAGQKQKAGL